MNITLQTDTTASTIITCNPGDACTEEMLSIVRDTFNTIKVILAVTAIGIAIMFMAIIIRIWTERVKVSEHRSDNRRAIEVRLAGSVEKISDEQIVRLISLLSSHLNERHGLRVQDVEMAEPAEGLLVDVESDFEEVEGTAVLCEK